MKNKSLKFIISTMDLPENRKDLTQITNIRWLDRNIFFRNRNHPDFNVAVSKIKQILLNNRGRA